ARRVRAQRAQHQEEHREQHRGEAQQHAEDRLLRDVVARELEHSQPVAGEVLHRPPDLPGAKELPDPSHHLAASFSGRRATALPSSGRTTETSWSADVRPADAGYTDQLVPVRRKATPVPSVSPPTSAVRDLSPAVTSDAPCSLALAVNVDGGSGCRCQAPCG